MAFDASGNLILPQGTILEFERERERIAGNRPTGVYVTCPGCGYTWERWTRRASRSYCRRCGMTIRLEALP
ncbi:MAG TPA: hypothetical protein VKU79_05820 [Thermoplasmataceae archaeon]|nr:hypothetical protein [Thermoplasmataceae archaeon]